MNLEEILKDFPILKTGIIYLDSAATSLTPEPVLAKMLEYYREYRANTGRGIYRLSQRATDEYERARSIIADLIGAKSDREIIITKNSTEGLNLIANGLKWKAGDRVVTTLTEHHSNFVTWLRLKRRHGVEVKVVRPDEEGIFDPDAFEKVMDDDTRLVAINHVSNVLGSIAPIKEISEIAHEHGAHLLVDGAQSVPRLPVDVQKTQCDFMAFSGHKMLGPTGVGVLYVKEEWMDVIEPLSVGGGTIKDVSIDDYSLTKYPERFEAGTPPIAEVIGLGEAAKYLLKIGLGNIKDHEEKLVSRMLQGLKSIPNLMLYGTEDPRLRAGIVSFNLEGLNPHDVALYLDVTANIMVRSGHHCAIPTAKHMIGDLKGSIRASVYIYNSLEEIDEFLSALKALSRRRRQSSP